MSAFSPLQSLPAQSDISSIATYTDFDGDVGKSEDWLSEQVKRNLKHLLASVRT